MSAPGPVVDVPLAAKAAPVMPRAVGVPSAISADLLAMPPRGLDRLMMALIALVGLFFVWAAFARIEEVTTGSGRIVPASKLQVVQNLEGGIVTEVLVREGASVLAGDTILRIDPTQAGSTLGETREKIDGYAALLTRLEAEANGSEPVFSEELKARRPDLVKAEAENFRARRDGLQSAVAVLHTQEQQRSQEIIEINDRIATLKRSLALAQEQLELMRPLVASMSASRAEMLAVESKVNDTAGTLSAAELSLPRLEAAAREARDRIAEKISAFRNEALQQMSTARFEAAVLSEQVKGNQDRVSRTTVKAPVSGIVKTVHVTTPGQVVQPGQSLIEIVPMNDTLLVEARVKPKDIAFLHPGQKAIVKLSAYDFALYGGLEGVVEHIGADSITDDKGETYYLINVRTSKRTLANKGGELPVIPGMVADVDVRTGEKTVLGYLMKPLTRMQQSALRER